MSIQDQIADLTAARNVYSLMGNTDEVTALQSEIDALERVSAKEWMAKWYGTKTVGASVQNAEWRTVRCGS